MHMGVKYVLLLPAFNADGQQVNVEMVSKIYVGYRMGLSAEYSILLSESQSFTLQRQVFALIFTGNIYSTCFSISLLILHHCIWFHYKES